jgi:FtsH-binding integral membrane protein
MVSNLWLAMGKSVVFGLLIALIGCHYGLRVKPNTESLGQGTTASVVTSITVVILIETIFLMNIFAEIKVTSVGGFAGNLTYLVFSHLNDATDVGMAAAGGLVAVVLANLVSVLLVRFVGKNLEA